MLAPRYVIACGSFGDYRLAVMKRVLNELNGEVALYAGITPYDRSIKTLTPEQLEMTALTNIFVWPGLLIQLGHTREILGAQSVILDLNPRSLSVWIYVLLRRLAGKRTVLWGHAWPRAGRSSKTESIRCALRNMASAILTYSHSQARELRTVHEKMPIYTAPNSLYLHSEIGFNGEARRYQIIYVGRLEPEKKPILLLDAFEAVADQISDAELVFVGAGMLKPEIEERIAQSRFASRVHALGHVNDYESLKLLYSNSVLSVSPGYVGLSITQSFAFGVPMVIGRDEPHAPEIEAAVEGVNCTYFDAGDVNSLARSLLEVWRDQYAWKERGPAIAEQCAKIYSIEAMADGIISALKGDPLV